MKLFKYLALSIGCLIVLFVGLVNYAQNTNPYTRVGEKYPAPVFRSSAWFEFNNSLDLKTFGFDKPNSKDALIVDFSKNDEAFNDSILNILANTDYLDDNLKAWRSVDLIFSKKKYKAKYRFHGSHTFIYNQGRFSLKIKSKKYIHGVKQFSLITGFTEGSALNIFLATQAQKQKLIAPDPGRIILANINNTVEDYWMTQDMSDDYMESRYMLKDYHVFENSDNWNRNGGPHYSELDGYYYYIDEDNSTELTRDSSTYIFYRDFMNAIDNEEDENLFSYVDKAYIGRFLANLYLFYEPHHVQGDNNKWLHDFNKSKFYPIARNEGVCEKIPRVLDFDNGLFHMRSKQSNTYDFYKRAMCDDSIKLYRDIELQRIVNDRDSILSDLNALYSEYYPLHKHYNETFMNLRFRHKKYNSVIRHNTNVIKNYIITGEVIIAFDPTNNEMRVATDIRVPLELTIPELSFSKKIKGVELSLEDGNLESELVEHVFLLDKKVNRKDIQITNFVSGDSISHNQIIFNYF